MNIKIISDSTCDLSPELIEKHDSTAASLTQAPPALDAVQSISLQKQMAQQNKQRAAVKEVSFAVGDRVRHSVFGEGTILSVANMAGDSLLEIAFDKVGTKKVMAQYARIRKV